MNLRKRVKKKKKLPSGFDSFLEVRLNKEMVNCDWKPPVIPYTTQAEYHPDAQFVTSTGETILIEIKGHFRTTQEATKYIWVRKALPDNHELVFVFDNPHTPMPRARRKKDGTRTTHAQWATKKHFTWYDKSDFPSEWSA